MKWKCSAECEKSQSDYLEYERKFLAKNPNYCRECDGFGIWAEEYDPSPYGVMLGRGTMVDMGPCEACEGQCALCRKPKHESLSRCPHCRQVPLDDGKAPAPECFCGFEL